MNHIAVALFLGVLLSGCGSAQVRDLTSRARGYAQTDDVYQLGTMLDPQPDSVRDLVLLEAPEAKAPYERWQSLNQQERDNLQKRFSIANESAPPPAPEATFAEPQEAVHAKLIELCATSNLAIIEANPNMVVCEGGAAFGNAMAHALLSPRYSSPAKERVRFVIYRTGEVTKVRASGWIESQSAFGQVNRTELTGANHMRVFRQALERIGGQ